MFLSLFLPLVSLLHPSRVFSLARHFRIRHFFIPFLLLSRRRFIDQCVIALCGACKSKKFNANDMHLNKLNFRIELEVKNIARTFYCGLKGAIQIVGWHIFCDSTFCLCSRQFLFHTLRPLVFRLFKIQIESSQIVFIVLNNLLMWTVACAVPNEQFQFCRAIPLSVLPSIERFILLSLHLFECLHEKLYNSPSAQ